MIDAAYVEMLTRSTDGALGNVFVSDGACGCIVGVLGASFAYLTTTGRSIPSCRKSTPNKAAAKPKKSGIEESKAMSPKRPAIVTTEAAALIQTHMGGSMAPPGGRCL